MPSSRAPVKQAFSMLSAGMHIAAPRPLAARRPAAPLAGTIRVPGDKSISHRALMFAALAVGETSIAGLLEGEDVLRTAAAMRALGAEVVAGRAGALARRRARSRRPGRAGRRAGHGQFRHRGAAAHRRAGQPSVFFRAHRRCQPAPPADAARHRSARCLWRAVCRARGWVAAARHRGRARPLPLDHRLAVPSAQVKSALLLCGLNAPGLTRIEEPEATRDHSENMLRHFGAEVSVRTAGGGGSSP